MVSVRQVAQECLGVTGTIVVDRDVYGYVFRDRRGRRFGARQSSDTLPGTGQPTARSLRQHLEQIQGRSINLSMFLVGHENDFSGSVTQNSVAKIQYAIQIARDIYAQAQLGIRRIYWRRIGVTAAGDYVEISNKAEAVDLTDDFSGPNDGIDVFWVRRILDRGVFGYSNREGPCDKDARDGQTGVVITLGQGHRLTGIILAHELGHYLGLPGDDSLTNLMGVKDGADDINENSTDITSSQASKMRQKTCYVRPGC
jgi:hypothetical protein